MEATESSYLSSPEASMVRSPVIPQQDHKSPPDSDSRQTYVRFLVSNAAAGSVIGKGGATITDFQAQTGARIQLSRNYEFYPGTSDRIIMISGAYDDVLKAVELVSSKLLSETQVEESSDDDARAKFRLVVPNNCCGSIIGKGGSIIKSFIEESRASIKISPQDSNIHGGNSRLVTIIGTLLEQMRAVELVLTKLSSDSHYPQTMQIPLHYTGNPNPMPYRQNGNGGKHQSTKEENPNSVMIGVADEHIGVVLGRGGRTIMEIGHASGARIKISNRGDFISGTTDRKVTISGSHRAIRTAENLILQKVNYAAEKETDE